MDKANPALIPQKQPGSHAIVIGSQAVMRWSNIVSRTFHIAVISLLFGGIIFDVPYKELVLSHWLTVFSGFLLVVLEWMHDDRFWHRGKGVCIFVHLGLCLLIHVFPPMIKPLLWLILISGCVGSHMARRYRHWSILEGWEKREGESKK